MVASLGRWLGSDGVHAGLLREFINRDKPFSVVDNGTFTVNLNEPYGSVSSAFARPHGVPVILPGEIVSSRGAFESLEIEELIGSGVYRLSEWLKGVRVTVERFEGYVPADGPPDLYIGGTAGYLDRIIWYEIPDEDTKIAGLQTGEWDVVDGAAIDFFQRLMDDPYIAVPVYRPGHRAMYHLNPSHPPFDSIRVRRAALFGTNVEEVMSSLGADELWDLCPAIFYCGTPLETDAGGDEWYARFDPDRARRLLGESTYVGETLSTREGLVEESGASSHESELLLMIDPSDHADYASIAPTGLVIRQQLEAIGFNVDMPAIDWAAVVTQTAEPDAFALSLDWQSHWCCGDPVSDSSGAGVSDFWPKIPYVTDLRLEWARQTDPAQRAAILDEYQIALYENVYNVYLGVFYPMFPHDVDLKDFVVKAIPFYSNSWLDR